MGHVGDGTLVSRGSRRFLKVVASLEISSAFDYSIKVCSLLSVAFLLGKAKRLQPNLFCDSQHLLCWVTSFPQFSPQSCTQQPRLRKILVIICNPALRPSQIMIHPTFLFFANGRRILFSCFLVRAD